MAEVSEIAIDTTASVVDHASTIISAIDTATSVVKNIGFLFTVTDLFKTPQHNKTKHLMERIAAANSAVNILQAREDLFTSNYYKSLKRLVKVLHNMKKFAEEITIYNRVQKFVSSKNIEAKYQELCKEYDSWINTLSFNLTVIIKFNAQDDVKILKDVLKFIEFQAALIKIIDGKIPDTVNILNILPETLLSFDDYRETEDGIRSEKLRKYVYKKTLKEFAFKIVDIDIINQIIILKKLKNCQNIIRFYGLTSDGNKFFLVTEWAENKNLREYISERGQDIEINLRIRIAYDIAKGLDFLNSIKIIHQNIRSENIVITEHDVAKITNFELCRECNTATDNLTVVKENVRYSAPEMLRGIIGQKTKYDTKCEVYSFGILLWEIAECRDPYEQFEDILEITKKVVSGYREKFTPGISIPEKYQILVNKSVSQNPGSRPTFSKMLTELQDIFKDYTYKPQIENYTPISRSHYLNNDRITFPVRKMTSSTIAAAVDDYGINYMF